MEKRIFKSAAITESELNTVSTSDLLEVFNSINTVNGNKPIAKFSDRKTAIRRTWASLPVHTDVWKCECGWEHDGNGDGEIAFDIHHSQAHSSPVEEDSDHLNLADMAKTVITELATKKIKTEKPKKESTLIKSSTIFNLVDDYEIRIPNTPQIRQICHIVKENGGKLTKLEIQNKLDEMGFRQSGLKIFAWYQKTLLSSALLSIS